MGMRYPAEVVPLEADKAAQLVFPDGAWSPQADVSSGAVATTQTL